MAESVVMLRDKHGPWAGLERPYTKTAAENALATGYAERIEADDAEATAPSGADGSDANDGSTLPFDPAKVKVKELPGRLAAVTAVDVVHELQKVDTRPSAAAHYERRVKELTEAA